MNPVKIHSVTLDKFSQKKLRNQKLAYLAGRHIVAGPEMHVEESFYEAGKHTVCLTLVNPNDTTPDAPVALAGIYRVFLDQDTVDKIEVAEDDTVNGQLARLTGCPYFVLVDIFDQKRQSLT